MVCFCFFRAMFIFPIPPSPHSIIFPPFTRLHLIVSVHHFDPIPPSTPSTIPSTTPIHHLHSPCTFRKMPPKNTARSTSDEKKRENALSKKRKSQEVQSLVANLNEHQQQVSEAKERDPQFVPPRLSAQEAAIQNAAKPCGPNFSTNQRFLASAAHPDEKHNEILVAIQKVFTSLIAFNCCLHLSFMAFRWKNG
jgi:hypothetical protein